MSSATELLRDCVAVIRRLTGAASVSLYLPADPAASREAKLIHAGGRPAVPELADLEAAQAFQERAATPEGIAVGDRFLHRIESASAEGCLVRIASPESLPSLLRLATPPDQRPPARRHTDSRDRDPGAEEVVWLGLESGAAGPPPWTRLQTDRSWLAALASALAWHERQMSALLIDPISGLFGRARFQTLLREGMERSRREETPLTLLLINPDDFAVVNETFGSEAGDAVIREIAQRLRGAIRSKDMLARYGGAIFAVGLFHVDTKVGGVVARKIKKKLTEAPYHRGRLRLGFCVGLADWRAAEDDDPDASALEIVRRADRALNAAKEEGGGRVVVWQAKMEPREAGSGDRLTGIFTANLAKDYRNMLVLWDTVIVVSNAGDFETLAAQLVERLHASFRADRVGLFEWSDAGEPRLIHGRIRTAGDTEAGDTEAGDIEAGGTGAGDTAPFELTDDERALLDQARTLGLAGKPDPVYSQSESKRFCCVPLVAREQCLGALYVDGRRGADTFDRSDSIFFRALAGQLAVTLDRTRLAAQDKRHQEQERRRLRNELAELRRALRQARLVYRSAEMETILTSLRRVAPSEATLLITGESGTGKELLARTAHELSPRHKKPLVVVDCGAIASSLIDRELFGHEKGAYTGAEKPAAGRLAEADGSTLVLDEIGELPLEVQSKLLRFTQEKVFTPVGGTRPRQVDVRIVAVTNRDLEREVAAGRFRADLFYRLNVLQIEVPPLRRRPDDVLFLARHFLERFSLQYQKRVQRFSPEAEAELLRHSWPGNVRELQNRVMQAVLVSETDEIGRRDLALDASETGGVKNGAPEALEDARTSAETPPGDHDKEWRSRDQVWEALAKTLGVQIDGALETATSMPLGRWLFDDLVLEAGAQTKGPSQGARRLGIPESTFRRRFRRAEAEAGFTQRPPGWEPIRPLVAALVRFAENLGEDVLERARLILLAQVLERVGAQDVTAGAALLGVSKPTFRRWVADSTHRH